MKETSRIRQLVNCSYGKLLETDILFCFWDGRKDFNPQPTEKGKKKTKMPEITSHSTIACQQQTFSTIYVPQSTTQTKQIISKYLKQTSRVRQIESLKTSYLSTFGHGRKYLNPQEKDKKRKQEEEKNNKQARNKQ